MKIAKHSKAFIAAVSFVCCFGNVANAASSYSARPDGHAPIGVMRDHVHKKGEVMFSYRYELMKMKGLQSGNKNISTSEALSNYMMAPTEMDMKMHMLGAMYGVTDKLSLMAMGSFIEKEMKMDEMMMGGMGMGATTTKAKQEISGFGDSKISAMYEFFNDSKNRLQFNFGVSIPTGSIKKSEGNRLAYPMQLGSGSYELLPGISYSGYQDSYSYGSQINTTFRLNKNNSDYKLGNVYNLTAWSAKKLNDSFSISSRLNYSLTQAIRGSDANIDAMMGPAANPDYSGGKKLTFLVGGNFIAPSGYFKGHRLALEAGVPLYQRFRGVQMKNDYNVTLGWQKTL